MIELTVKNSDENRRLDKYLKQLLPNASGGFIYKMLRKKNITLNGAKGSGSELLSEGDVIRLFLSDETFEKMSAAGTDTALCDTSDINMVYEDDAILVLNKPWGVLSQKSRPSDISLNDEIRSYLYEKGEITATTLASYKPSVINRLDRNTSGLILAAKSYKAARELSSALSDRRCKKFYRCMVSGDISEEHTKKAWLKKDEKTNTAEVYDEPHSDAKPIATRFYPIENFDGVTHIEVELLTGRTHQIRAHLAHIGHPVIGDIKYGDAALNREFKEKYAVTRQLLHSYRLILPDEREFTAPLPDDFLRLQKHLTE